MRLVSFLQDGDERLGLVHGDAIIDPLLAAGDRALFGSALAFIRSGERAISALSFGAIQTSITCWRRPPRSIAVLRKLTTLSDAERRRKDSTPAAALGKAMPVTSAIMVSTISSSMSVMPACVRLFVAPADNVGVIPFSAGLAVGAQ